MACVSRDWVVLPFLKQVAGAPFSGKYCYNSQISRIEGHVLCLTFICYAKHCYKLVYLNNIFLLKAYNWIKQLVLKWIIRSQKEWHMKHDRKSDDNFLLKAVLMAKSPGNKRDTLRALGSRHELSWPDARHMFGLSPDLWLGLLLPPL